MRTPAAGRSLTRSDTTSSATSVRRPTVESRSYVLAFGCGRSTMTAPSSPARPATKTTGAGAGAFGAKRHELETHAS
jgi:hypothetical protein